MTCPQAKSRVVNSDTNLSGDRHDNGYTRFSVGVSGARAETVSMIELLPSFDEIVLGREAARQRLGPKNRHSLAKGRDVFYICSSPPRRKPMSDSVSAAPADASRSRSAAAPRAARRGKTAREIRLLSGGLSIAET